VSDDSTGLPPDTTTQPPAVPTVTSTARTSPQAIAGLILAILSWLICPVIAAIPALILAHRSSSEIRAANGEVDGAGLNTATRVISWANVAVTVAAGIALLALIAYNATSSDRLPSGLDPQMNTRTGLADGRYTIDPGTRININRECSYGGLAVTTDGRERQFTTVYGNGPAQCPDLVLVKAVVIEVEDGVATIVEVR